MQRRIDGAIAVRALCARESCWIGRIACHCDAVCDTEAASWCSSRCGINTVQERVAAYASYAFYAVAAAHRAQTISLDVLLSPARPAQNKRVQTRTTHY
jgi:hypothetical protein